LSLPRWLTLFSSSLWDLTCHENKLDTRYFLLFVCLFVVLSWSFWVKNKKPSLVESFEAHVVFSFYPKLFHSLKAKLTHKNKCCPKINNLNFGYVHGLNKKKLWQVQKKQINLCHLSMTIIFKPFFSFWRKLKSLREEGE
jgi:hypothetical protein